MTSIGCGASLKRKRERAAIEYFRDGAVRLEKRSIRMRTRCGHTVHKITSRNVAVHSKGAIIVTQGFSPRRGLSTQFAIEGTEGLRDHYRLRASATFLKINSDRSP